MAITFKDLMQFFQGQPAAPAPGAYPGGMEGVTVTAPRQPAPMVPFLDVGPIPPTAPRRLFLAQRQGQEQAQQATDPDSYPNPVFGDKKPNGLLEDTDSLLTNMRGWLKEKARAPGAGVGTQALSVLGSLPLVIAQGGVKALTDPTKVIEGEMSLEQMNEAAGNIAGMATGTSFLFPKSLRPSGSVLGAGVRSGTQERVSRASQSAPTLAEGLPAVRTSLEGFRPGGAEPTLKDVLDVRAQQMQLPPKERMQPDAAGGVFETTPEAYTRSMPEQTAIPVPRGVEGKSYPLGDRVRPIIDKQEQIAQLLAERAKPFLGTDAQYFYHTYGPIVEGAVSRGVDRNVAMEWLRDFAKNYAATSPRTTTEQNLRNATLSMAKKRAGIPHTTIVGPGTEVMNGAVGVSEKGYPMMLGEGGIHRSLLDAIESPTGIDFNVNPKPGTFAENSAGNLSGVTVDTHAIRGVFDAINELNPGSVPEAWIKKEHRAAYKNDPSKFNAANMVDDGLASQKINKTAVQSEYGPFSDVYKRVAEILGVQPAEAQSLAWFGSGYRTGLASELKTIPKLLNERINVTSKLLGISETKVLKLLMEKKIPLLSAAAISAGGLDDEGGVLADIKKKLKSR